MELLVAPPCHRFPKEPSDAEILGNASSEERKGASSNVIAFQEFTVSEKPFSTETVNNRLG